MTPSESRSQRRTNAGAGAVALTLFSLVWNAAVWGFLLPESEPPMWFKAVFVGAGILVAWGAVASWANRFRGGGVDLQLSQDPVPHGVPTVAKFALGKVMGNLTWTLDVVIETSDGPQSGFGQVWEHRFPVSTVPSMVGGEVVVQAVHATFTLPPELPSTQDKSFRAALVLNGSGMSWRFNLETRPATSSELSFHSANAAWAPGKIQAAHPLPGATGQPSTRLRTKRSPHQTKPLKLRWIARLVGYAFLGWIAWGMLGPLMGDVPDTLQRVRSLLKQHVPGIEALWPEERSQGVQGAVIAGSQSDGDMLAPDRSNEAMVSGDAPDFPVIVSNWLMDDWRYRAHLEGTAHIRQGELRVRIRHLQMMPVSPCQGQSDCRIRSVGLLLSHETGGSFRKLAESAPLPWEVNLGEVRRATRSEGEWVMPLPKTWPAGDVRLKLVVQSERVDPETGKSGPSWVYPSHGNPMALRMAVAQAQSTSDGASENPCEAMATPQTAVRAGCNEWLSRRLMESPKLDQATLDDALIAAVLHFNGPAVPQLLEAGANPNAPDPQNRSHTALAWAAAGNQLDTMQALLQAGAKVHHRAVSKDEQIIMPLTLALKRDAAQAVELLLKSGARLNNNDLNGWTVMHIAAFEGATDSLAVLAAAGGDVNQKASAYRHQTAFHTALQYAPQSTIDRMLASGADLQVADNQGENACGWAKYFGRSQAIQTRVCR